MLDFWQLMCFSQGQTINLLIVVIQFVLQKVYLHIHNNVFVLSLGHSTIQALNFRIESLIAGIVSPFDCSNSLDQVIQNSILRLFWLPPLADLSITNWRSKDPLVTAGCFSTSSTLSAILVCCHFHLSVFLHLDFSDWFLLDIRLDGKIAFVINRHVIVQNI